MSTAVPHKHPQYIVVRISAKRWQIAKLTYGQIHSQVMQGNHVVQGIAPQYDLHGRPDTYITEQRAINACAELNAATMPANYY